MKKIVSVALLLLLGCGENKPATVLEDKVFFPASCPFEGDLSIDLHRLDQNSIFLTNVYLSELTQNPMISNNYGPFEIEIFSFRPQNEFKLHYGYRLWDPASSEQNQETLGFDRCQTSSYSYQQTLDIHNESLKIYNSERAHFESVDTIKNGLFMAMNLTKVLQISLDIPNFQADAEGSSLSLSKLKWLGTTKRVCVAKAEIKEIIPQVNTCP